jgi:hypothetical protein
MKKFIRTLLVLVMVAGCFNFILFTKKAEAMTSSTIPLQFVDDLDNTPYPATTAISYDYNHRNYSKFTIDSPGQLKAIFRCAMDSKSSGTAWVSTDMLGNDVVGEVFKFSGSETDLSWFLESGTYYIFSTWSTYPNEVNAALLFEKSKANEKVTTTSFYHSNLIDLKRTVRGFLSYFNPNDYYSFNLTKKALITVKYSFDTSSAAGDAFGYCTLYDENELFMTEGTYQKNDKGLQEYTYLLEPGTYYIKLYGLLGNTTLSVSPMYYDISLSADTDNSWTKKTVNVDIDTTIDYAEVMVLAKDVKEALLNKNDVWSVVNEAYVKVDGLSFTAKKSGIYSVRITDKYGNHTMQKLEITNIDITKPEIKGVTNNKAYKKPVTLTWSDKQSGINKSKTTLNGKEVNSGTTVTKEGKYTLKVYDMVGNYNTIVFYVDYTAPTAGVTDGKTYTDSVTLKFKDNVSGIKKITLDDVELSAAFNSTYCYLDGEYTVKLWDNAGNYRKIVFTIKKK